MKSSMKYLKCECRFQQGMNILVDLKENLKVLSPKSFTHYI